jgi:hypothetical protein
MGDSPQDSRLSGKEPLANDLRLLSDIGLTAVLQSNTNQAYARSIFRDPDPAGCDGFEL